MNNIPIAQECDPEASSWQATTGDDIKTKVGKIKIKQ